MSKLHLSLGLILLMVCVFMSAASGVQVMAQSIPQGRIAFSSDRDGKSAIYVMNADGSGVTKLTDTPANASIPIWSPDGSKIAYVMSDVTTMGQIYVMNADGSNPTKLSNFRDPGYSVMQAWSPDSKQIAFVHVYNFTWQIYVVNTDGKNLTNLTGDLESSRFPEWSPDGKRITFMADYYQNYEIMTMNANGSGVTNLTNDIKKDNFPVWSPDGKRIAFLSNRSGYYQVYVMNANGTGVTPLANIPEREVRYEPARGLAWAPDGKKVSLVYKNQDSSNTKIYLLNADGSGTATPVYTDPGSFYWELAWSPDSQYMAFGVSGDIYRINADGTGKINLTNNPAYDSNPSWSSGPKGKTPPTQTATVTRTFTPTPTPMPGSCQEFPPTSERKTTFHGTVSFTQGNGAGAESLKGIAVQLENAVGKAVCFTQTQDDGTYSISGALSEGQYTLKALLEDKDGQRRITADGSSDAIWVKLPVLIPAPTGEQTVNISFSPKLQASDSSNQPGDRLVKAAWVYARSYQVQKYVTETLKYTDYTPPAMIRLWLGSSSDGWEWAKYIAKDSTGDPNSIRNTIEVSYRISENILSKSPMVLWHEEFHHLADLVIPNLLKRADNEQGCNHAGIFNSSSRDSLMEGWAEFWPVVMSDKSLWHYSNDVLLNLEVDFRSWDQSSSSDPQRCVDGLSTGPAQYEEFAAAGLLWDLIDGKDDAIRQDQTSNRSNLQPQTQWYEMDTVQMDPASLFAVMTAPDPNGETLSTVKDLYNRLSAQALKGGTSFRVEDINQLWVNHGFFGDQNKNRAYELVETVGWSGKYGRYSPPPVPDAYLTLDSLPDGSRPTNARVEVRIRDSIASYGFSYTLNVSEWPFKIYMIPPLPYRVGMVDLTIVQNNQTLAAYSLDNQKYWEWVSTSPKEKSRSINPALGKVNQAPAGLRLLSSSPILNQDAAFFGASVEAGEGVSYAWNFGDGATATGQIVYHVYTQPGDYTVSLNVSNDLGSATQAQTIHVIKNEGRAPTFWETLPDNILWYAAILGAFLLLIVVIVLIVRRRKKPTPAPVKAAPPAFRARPAVLQSTPAVQPTTPKAVLSPAELDDLFAQARAWMNAGQYGEVEPILRKILQSDEKNAQGWFMFGAVMFQKKDFRAAKLYLTRAQQYGHPHAAKALERLQQVTAPKPENPAAPLPAATTPPVQPATAPEKPATLPPTPAPQATPPPVASVGPTVPDAIRPQPIPTASASPGQIVQWVDQLGSDVPGVSEQAVAALSAVGPLACLALIETLESPGPRDPAKNAKEQRRKLAQRLLAQMGAAAVPALIQAFAHQNKNIRMAALTPLAAIGAPAIPLLLETLENPTISTYAPAALALIGSPAAGPLANYMNTCPRGSAAWQLADIALAKIAQAPTASEVDKLRKRGRDALWYFVIPLVVCFVLFLFMPESSNPSARFGAPLVLAYLFWAIYWGRLGGTLGIIISVVAAPFMALYHSFKWRKAERQRRELEREYALK